MREQQRYIRSAIVLDVLMYLLIGALLVFSISLMKERIMLSDTSGYLLNLINNKTFCVPTNRFVSIFTQVLPLGGIALGLSFKTVLLLYSLNCTLIAVAIALTCRYLFKDLQSTWATLLFYVLMAANVFFYPVTEFLYGLLFLLLYHALCLAYQSRKRVTTAIFYPTALCLLPILLFAHPMMTPVFFTWLASLVIVFGLRDKRFIGTQFLLSIIILGAKRLFFHAPFKERIIGLGHFKLGINQYFSGRFAETFTPQFRQYYWLLAVLILLTVVLFCLKKRWLPAVLVLLVSAFYWVLVAVTFRDDIYDYYFEHLLQPLPFFLALFFVTALFSVITNKRLLYGLLGLTAFLSLSHIYQNKTEYSARLQWYQNYLNLMQEMDIEKAALSRHYISRMDPKTYWTAGIESLLLSAYNGGQSTLFLAWNFEQAYVQEALPRKNILVLDGYDIPFSEFNPKYFQMDTLRGYTILDSVVAPERLEQLRIVKP